MHESTPHPPELDTQPLAARPGRGTVQAAWEAAFWLLFERSSNAIALLDEERCFVELNGPAEDLLGLSRAQAIGHSIIESVTSGERAESTKEWQAFLHTGSYAGYRSLVRPDGGEVEIEFAATLTWVGDRRLAVYVAMPVSGSHGVHGQGADALTKREREIVTLIALGQETPEIAQALFVSPATVRTHVRNAMAKMGARTRAQLVALALCAEGALQVAALD